MLRIILARSASLKSANAGLRCALCGFGLAEQAIEQRRKRCDRWGGHWMSPELVAKRVLAYELKYD
ncbi:hypothetical protein ACVMAJ_007241 [Bradyrhizobium sp. USDA 4448]